MATETIALGFNRDLPHYKTCPKLLIGEKAVVTRSSAGIGKAVAEGLARAGAEVVINYAHDAAGAQAAAAKAIENDGGKAIIIQADVSKPDDIKSLFQTDLAGVRDRRHPRRQLRHPARRASHRYDTRAVERGP